MANRATRNGNAQGRMKGREERWCVINRPPEPKIVRLEGWEERELFSDGLDEGF